MANILVIDDDAELQEILKLALEEEGHTVYGALDGVSGIRKMLDTVVDLVVLDIMMPGMDGYEVCRKLKESPSTAVPVLFLSAKTLPEDIEQAYRVGADDYVTKPFDLGDLRQRVNSILEKTGPAA